MLLVRKLISGATVEIEKVPTLQFVALQTEPFFENYPIISKKVHTILSFETFSKNLKPK